MFIVLFDIIKLAFLLTPFNILILGRETGIFKLVIYYVLYIHTYIYIYILKVIPQFSLFVEIFSLAFVCYD